MKKVLSDFPLLNNLTGERSFYYLDNAATSQKPQQVIDAINQSYTIQNAPIHRGLYGLADLATQAYERSRLSVSNFINARASEEVIFTRSATESINMVAQGWLKLNLSKGDKVWVTAMEHHANLLPWQRVCQETGAELCFIELNLDGSLDFDSADELYGEKTRFIALTHISNVLGVINPVKTVIERAKEKGISVLIDATQSVGHVPVDVQELNCDFLVFSAHKMYGPTGIGVLYGKSEKLEVMEPLLLGGGMVDEVNNKESSWAELPIKLEAGSPNFSGAVGLASAIDYIEKVGLDRLQNNVESLTEYAFEKLMCLNGLKIHGPVDPDKNAGIISFNLEGVHPHDVAQMAGDNNVAIRTGHHCCQPLMKRLDVIATARASIAPYNLEKDIDALVDVIKTTQEFFS